MNLKVLILNYYFVNANAKKFWLDDFIVWFDFILMIENLKIKFERKKKY